MILSALASQNLGLLLIAASAIGFYIAARVAVEALTDFQQPVAARLALAHWLPIALTAIIAVSVGEPVIGVCIAFGTCVAALFLNLGLITATTGDTIGPAESSGAWPLLVPVALLALIAGFRAQVNWVHAGVLVVEGLMVVLLWRPSAPAIHTAPAPLSMRQTMSFILALFIAILAGYIAIYGTLRMSAEIPLTTPGLIASVGLAPLLVLPMIGTGTLLAERGHASTAAAGLIAVALLNLCLLLPLLVVAACIRNWLAPLHEPMRVPIPIATWRVDTILILIVSVVLAPVALGRWRLGRFEGVVLVLVYAAYLGATSVLAVRW